MRKTQHKFDYMVISYYLFIELPQPLSRPSVAPVESAAQRRPPPLDEIEVLEEESAAPVEIVARHRPSPLDEIEVLEEESAAPVEIVTRHRPLPLDEIEVLEEDSAAPVEIVARHRPPPLDEIAVFGEESAAPIEIVARCRPPVPIEPVICIVQGSEPISEHQPSSSSTRSERRHSPPDAASPLPPAKRRKTAGHKLGFDVAWTVERPWAFSAIEDGTEVMLCKVCIAHHVAATTGKRCWVDYGCRSLRKDLLLIHEKSNQHQEAVKVALSKTERIDVTLRAVDLQEQLVTEDAIKVVNFIVQHNLSLDLFADLVELAIDLGAKLLSKLNAGKNATHTSSKTVSGLLNCLTTEVDAKVTEHIRRSPTYSVMADEVTDVVSMKHLAMLCRYVNPDGTTATVLMNDVEIANGTANTITAAISQELQERQLDVVNMSTLSADGASTFSGHKTGVGAQLRQMNPSLLYYHCRDHRLALACKTSFAKIPLLAKVDNTLDALNKYYTYSAVHHASLQKVQAAFGEPQLSMKEAKHHRWLSHEKAVSALVRSYRYVYVENIGTVTVLMYYSTVMK